jgi:hypothetical protein
MSRPVPEHLDKRGVQEPLGSNAAPVDLTATIPAVWSLKWLGTPR